MNDSRKPAVALFVHRFPVVSETFVASEAAALVELGHRVHVEARRRAEASDLAVPAGVEVHCAEDETREERLRAHLWLLGRHPLRAATDLLAQRARAPAERGLPLRRLAPRARRIGGLAPQVHIHSHFAVVTADEAHRIGRLLRVPTSLTAHAYDIYLTPRRLYERLTRTDFATSGCDYMVAHLRDVAGPGYADSIFKQIMGIDPSAFARENPLPGGRHVVAVGRLVEKKGFVHLIRAVARMPETTVSIAGEGPERAALEAEIDRLGLGDRVTLLGATPPTGVHALLERADLLCMPCVVAANGDRDSMPVVVKEAMAMELCIVASDEVGLPELIRPPWGALAPPGDDAALAAAIDHMLAKGLPERAALGRAARRDVIEYGNLHTETEKLSVWITEGT